MTEQKPPPPPPPPGIDRGLRPLVTHAPQGVYGVNEPNPARTHRHYIRYGALGACVLGAFAVAETVRTPYCPDAPTPPPQTASFDSDGNAVATKPAVQASCEQTHRRYYPTLHFPFRSWSNGPVASTTPVTPPATVPMATRPPVAAPNAPIGLAKVPSSTGPVLSPERTAFKGFGTTGSLFGSIGS